MRAIFRKKGPTAGAVAEVEPEAKGEIAQLAAAESAQGRNGVPTATADAASPPQPSAKAPGRHQRWSRRLALRPHTTTVSIEDDVVRVVVLAGRDVVAWGTGRLGDGGSTAHPGVGDIAADVVRDANRLRAFVRRVHPQPGRIVTDLPLYAPLVRRFQLPRISRRKYLGEVIESELAEMLPFAMAEMDVKWRLRRLPDGTPGHDVYATAVPKGVVDRSVYTLVEAGLRPVAAYGQAAALAFAGGVADGLVVRLEPSHVTVVLVRDHVPEVVHRAQLPPQRNDEEDSHGDRADLVARVVEQTAGYDETLDQRAATRHLPVVLVGALARDASFVSTLTALTQREALPFQPALTHPEHFSPAEYAVNLGLALAHRAGGRRLRRISTAGTASINLLSERHRPRPLPVGPVAVFVALLLFGTAALNVTSTVTAMESEAAILSERSTALRAEARLRRLEAAQLRKAAERTAAATQTVEVLETHLSALEDEMDTLRDRLGEVTRDAAPLGVRIVGLRRQEEGYAVTGLAPSYERVLDYAEGLRTSGLFTDVQVLHIESSSKDAETLASFQVWAAATPAQESGVVSGSSLLEPPTPPGSLF